MAPTHFRSELSEALARMTTAEPFYFSECLSSLGGGGDGLRDRCGRRPMTSMLRSWSEVRLYENPVSKHSWL